MYGEPLEEIPVFMLELLDGGQIVGFQQLGFLLTQGTQNTQFVIAENRLDPVFASDRDDSAAVGASVNQSPSWIKRSSFRGAIACSSSANSSA